MMSLILLVMTLLVIVCGGIQAGVMAGAFSAVAILLEDILKDGKKITADSVLSENTLVNFFGLCGVWAVCGSEVVGVSSLFLLVMIVLICKNYSLFRIKR